MGSLGQRTSGKFPSGIRIATGLNLVLTDFERKPLMKSVCVTMIVAIAAGVAACSSSDTTSERPKAAFNKVYEPERGVVCDRIERACYDGEGPAIAATEKYLGDDAARRFQIYVDRVGAKNITSIEFSDGVVCSYKSEVCRKTQFPDSKAPYHARALFER